MSHDHSGSSGGCFSGIGRLLLCKGSLQTHPSDIENILNDKYYSNNNSALMLNSKVEEAPHSTTANPGVVARLMGLDSFPLPDPNLLVTRSRSVNFMDYYLPPPSSSSDRFELDHQFKQQRQKHRRVRTCVSFRADDRGSDPVVFGSGNEHNFFVFSLDNDHHHIEKTKKKSGNVTRRIRKQTIVENIVKQKQLEEKNKKMIIPEGVLVSKSRFVSCKQVSSGVDVVLNDAKTDGVPLNKKKKQKKSMIINQKESKFINKIKDHHHQLPLSERKNSPKVSNYNKVNKSTEQKRVTEEEVKRLRRLTEEDMKESKLEIKFQNIEEMCLYFGEQIVDLLVEKLVEELLLH